MVISAEISKRRERERKRQSFREREGRKGRTAVEQGE